MKNIELSGEQRQQLQSALIDAFPTTATLEQMLSFGLNKNLRAIAGEGSLQDIVFRLIQVAESQGWLQDLIRAACKSNPGNAILRDVAQDLMQNYLKTSDNSSFRFVLFPRKGDNEPSTSAKHFQIRQALLKQVIFEVESRINSSLHNRVYVVLDIEQNPNKIELPWESEIKVANKPKIILRNTNIITVFDQPDIEGRLLILGQPGSGKTTMLLKLAEALISRANNDPTEPIPVLFSLSSWKDDNQNIKDWLVKQLKDKYGLQKNIGKLWINNQKIIPLLDGLDELVAKRQEKCVLKINQFLHPSNWNNPVIVCSRIQEYTRYKTLLQLNNSLELYPFSEQQVYQYLQNTDHLPLWDSISHDADLRQLAKTPFLLNIIVLSAQEISIQTWQEFKSSEERLSYLFDAYIRRMLKRPYKGKYRQPTEENTKIWLSLLAYQLIEESDSEFFIKKKLPDWLNKMWDDSVNKMWDDSQRNRFYYLVPLLPILFILLIIYTALGTISWLINAPKKNENYYERAIRQVSIKGIYLLLLPSLILVSITFITEIISKKHEINDQVFLELLCDLYFGINISGILMKIPVISRFIARVILWSSGYGPWNYDEFLDYCTNRLFLQRVDGGYQFIHNLLRQHFAKSYRNPQT